MAKTVAAIVKLIDQFSSPSRTISKKSKQLERQFSNMGAGFKNAGTIMTNAGKTMTKNVTMPVAGIAGAAVKTAADFEAGMSKVKAISGASAEDMKKLTDRAKEMGLKTKYSASESAEAMQYMAMAGWKTKQMTAGLPGIMYLAGSSGEDLAKVSDIVTDSLTAFGMKAGESGHFADVLSAASANANTNVAMMGESFKYAAPLAGAMKYSVEDTATAIGLMANAGIKSDQAGTSMRAWLTRMAKPTKQSAEAMKALGLSITDSGGKMKPLRTITEELRGKFKGLTEEQKTQYAAMLAGQNGMSGLLAVVNASEKDYGKLAGAIDKCKGAAKKQYDVMNDNLTGQITTLKSTVESAAVTIGEKLLPYIKKATEYVQKAATWFNNLSDKQLSNIMKWAGIAAAIGPVLMIFGKLSTGIGNVITNYGKLSGALMRLTGGKGGFKVFGALLKGPVWIAMAAIAAGAILVYKNWDKVGPIVRKIGGRFQEFASTVMPMLEPVIKFFKEAFAKAFDFVGNHIGDFFKVAQNVIDGVLTMLEGVITFLSGVFTGDWKKIWEGIKKILVGAFKGIAALVKVPINAVIGLANKAIGAINDIGVDVPDILGGGHIGFSIPTIPTLAKGTNYWKGGIVQVSEKGGEIIDLPRGSRVYPHDESVKMARNEKNEVKITINKLADYFVVREEADIKKIAEAVAKEFVELSPNMG